MAGTGIKTLFYSPQVKILVTTWDGKNYDLSADVVSGSVNRSTNTVSTFSAELNNRGSKYTGKLSRMDRVTVYLKKTTFMQVFSGYLTQVPALDMYATTCTIKGQCTLKRLLHTYWDPYLQASSDLLVQKNLAAPDAGIGDTLIQLMTEVGGWNPEQLHIQQIPPAFINYTLNQQYVDRTDPEVYVQKLMQALGCGGVVAGVPQNPVTGGAGPAGLEAFMHALRVTESGGTDGNYTSVNPSSGASGAYQYLDSSWNHYQGTTKASQADKATQDARATADITARYVLYGSNGQPSWERVAASWLAGIKGSADMSKWGNHPGKSGTNSSIQSYVNNVIAKMNGYSGDYQTPAADPNATTTGTTEVMIYPLPGAVHVNSGFGLRTAPKSGASSNHKGVDLQAAMDTKVMAAASGKVTQVSSQSARGNFIVIDHGNGIETLYQHLHRAEVSVGQQVTIGQEIAKSGNTGVGTGPHLHFEVHVNGKPVDPEPYIGKSLTVVAGATPTATTDSTPDTNTAIFNAMYRTNQYNALSENLHGDRAFANDEQLMVTVQALVAASLRRFMSAPNGDFIAFFPDYFGLFGGKAKLQLEEVEMKDVYIDANDNAITTHVFSFGDMVESGSVNIADMGSGGFVNIMQPYVFDSLLNLQPTKNTFYDPQSFLNRFGLRPLTVQYPQIKNSDFEYFLALQKFFQKWSEQYSTTVQFTFMPELYPGMRVQLADWGIQVYVESVTHTWDMSSGFQTTASITSPSAIGSNAVQGLPIGRA